jgi:hypothetical protein
MAVKPISPSEISEKKVLSFPDAVLESFNELIVQNYSHGQATFYQDEVVKLMVSKGLKRGEIFDKHYLDVEQIYEAEGWKVVFDNPGYNESYAANFTFIKGKK